MSPGAVLIIGIMALAGLLTLLCLWAIVATIIVDIVGYFLLGCTKLAGKVRHAKERPQ